MPKRRIQPKDICAAHRLFSPSGETKRRIARLLFCMKHPLLMIPTTAFALALVALPFTTVDLRADDLVPPVPPGKSLPPPLPPASTSTPPSTSSAQPSVAGTKNQPGAQINQRLEKLKQELGLSPAQVAKIKPIFERAAQQIKALRAGVSMSAAEKKQQIRQIFKSSFEQIRPILTTQQFQKWQQIRSQHRAAAAES
jgi:hypothetical protein